VIQGTLAHLLDGHDLAREEARAAMHEIMRGEATQAQIAQLSGASRESASRFLAKLERAGVITTGRGKILVHEPAALNNYIY